MRIDGDTAFAGIIGQPVKHSLSPLFQNAALEHAGLNWVYLPFEVDPSRLEAAVFGLAAAGCRGLNVTMPYKHEIIRFLDELSESAAAVDAVNTIEFRSGRMIGHNTDGRGFVASLRLDVGFEPQGKTAIVVGAGGAGRAVAVALARAGARKLKILNRRSAKAEELDRLIRSHYPDCEVEVAGLAAPGIRGYDLIVNATPIGMEESPGLPISLEGLEKEQVVYDIVYWPLETELLGWAKKIGAATVSGARMLLHQGAASFTVWTGKHAPLDEMARVLDAELKGKGMNG